MKFSAIVLSVLLFELISLTTLLAQATIEPINSGLGNLNIQSLAISHIDPNVFYVGTGGGLFQSNNRGVTWSPCKTDFSEEKILEIVFDPIDSKIVFLSTATNGVFKSIDGGLNWSKANTGLPSLNVTKLAVNPSNNSIIYANPDGYGIYKSSNGGYTWTAVGRGRDVRNFVIDPVHPNIIYAATVQYVLKSSDYGDTWSDCGTKLPSPFINGLTIDHLNPSVLFSGPYQKGVWKTENGGQHWFESNKGIPRNQTVLSLVIDHSNPDIVYAVTDRNGVYISYNSGDFWYSLNLGLEDMSVKKNTFTMDPLDSDVIYFGTDDKGIFKINLSASN